MALGICYLNKPMRTAFAAILAGSFCLAVLPFAAPLMTNCAAAETPLVVVSIPPQAYFVRRIAGETTAVRVLIPPGTNFHTFEPTVDQFESVANAAVYFQIGHPQLRFEKLWKEKALAENPALLVVDTGEGMTGDDPHWWVGPHLVRLMAAKIRDGLKRVAPTDALRFDKGFDEFSSEITQLEGDLQQTAARGRKQFFVFHPAWGYLAAELGLEQVAIERDGKEADVNTIGDIIVKARAAKAKYIFVEPAFSEDSAQIIAEEVGAKIDKLDPMAEDWSNNLRRVVQMISQP
jgi:zinc transport system substrate-binding protein